MEEYVYSTDDEHYKSFDEVMSELESEYEPESRIIISKAKPVEFTHASFIDLSRMIEDMQNEACDACGEASEEYLSCIPKEKMEELEKVVADWFDKNIEQPNFYGVTDVEEITVTVED